MVWQLCKTIGLKTLEQRKSKHSPTNFRLALERTLTSRPVTNWVNEPACILMFDLSVKPGTGAGGTKIVQSVCIDRISYSRLGAANLENGHKMV